MGEIVGTSVPKPIVFKFNICGWFHMNFPLSIATEFPCHSRHRMSIEFICVTLQRSYLVGICNTWNAFAFELILPQNSGETPERLPQFSSLDCRGIRLRYKLLLAIEDKEISLIFLWFTMWCIHECLCGRNKRSYLLKVEPKVSLEFRAEFHLTCKLNRTVSSPSISFVLHATAVCSYSNLTIAWSAICQKKKNIFLRRRNSIYKSMEWTKCQTQLSCSLKTKPTISFTANASFH